MTFLGIFTRISRSSSRNGFYRSPDLLSAADLKFVMERERMRSDRSSLPFTLVAFRLGGYGPRQVQVRRLEIILRNRLRLTDDKGWLEDGRIGVVLPDTPVSGASVVAEDICQQYCQAGGWIDYELYLYPSDLFPDSEPSWNTQREGVTQDVSADDGRVSAMDALFIKPLPFWKRATDLGGAALALLVFSPLMIVVGVLLKLTSTGPLLFVQWRAGLGGRPFRIYKFRTMCVDAEARKARLLEFNEQDGPAFKLSDDPRVTAIGRLLRKTSIDELPQLWNVLKGDMTLVGPRPLPCEESDACQPWHRRRLDATPGVTCIWQVKGRSRVTFADWVRMDLQYIHAVSLAHDLKLLSQTVVAVLLGKGPR